MLILASLFICNSMSLSFECNPELSPVTILVLAWAISPSSTVAQNVSVVVLDSLQWIISCPRNMLASTLTLCGMIENVSHTTLQRSAYNACILSYCVHWLVTFGNNNVQLILIGSGWFSSRLGLSYPQCFGDSDIELIKRLVAGNICAVWLLCIGVISVIIVGIKYSSSSRVKSYSSTEDWKDPNAMLEWKRMMLSMHLGLLVGKHLYLAQLSFSMYFR